MDHGVGKLDCIQKLCKKLEDCEQRVHELEATNAELRAEHEDMEEEAKYLKYVLSYRGDVMRAQLQNEYETKISALKDELEQARDAESSSSEVAVVTKRNQALQEEVNILCCQLMNVVKFATMLFLISGDCVVLIRRLRVKAFEKAPLIFFGREEARNYKTWLLLPSSLRADLNIEAMFRFARRLATKMLWTSICLRKQ